MTTSDLTNATHLQIRRMVAEALGWTPIPQAHGESVMGFPPGDNRACLFSEWDREFDGALGLLLEFNERRKASRMSRAGMVIKIDRNLSGFVRWEVKSMSGEIDFDLATVDGPLAICRAFLAAIAALEKAQEQQETTWEI